MRSAFRRQSTPERRLLTEADATALAQAVRHAIRALGQVLVHLQGHDRDVAFTGSLIQLSQWEMEVLTLVDRGLPDAEIARKLGISLRTVHPPHLEHLQEAGGGTGAWQLPKR